MKIKKLTLVGYKRLLLRNLSYFEYTPTGVHQLIIGTNGCGKSSVLKELSPLPAFAGNYVKGGSKTIELEHRGKNYVLTSNFTSGNKHSFVVDGVELNPGFTGTVQKELVWQHFQLTDELHEVLSGETRFTQMQPLKRREWIIKLSGSDLEYAMQIYGELKSKARDMQGVVKHLNQRLTQESDKLPSVEQVEELTHTAGQLKHELVLMMEAKEANLPQAQELKARIETNLSMIEELSIAAIEARVHRPDFIGNKRITSLVDLEDIIDDMRNQMSVNNGMLDHYHDEYSKIREIVDTLAKSNAQGLDDLALKIESMQLKHDEMALGIQQFKLDTDALLVSLTTDAVMPELVELFMQLPDNTDKRFSRDKRDEVRARFEEQRNLKEKLQNHLIKVEHRIDHINKASTEKCPSCGYLWMPGVRDNEMGDLQRLQVRLDREIKEHDQAAKDAEAYLLELQQYSDLQRRFVRLVESNPRMQVLWDWILENRKHLESPKSALPVFAVWKNDVVLSAELNQLDTQIANYRAAHAQAASMGGDGHYNERIEHLNDNISRCTDAREDFKRKLKILSQYMENVTEILDNARAIQERIRIVNSDLELLSRATRRDILTTTIREHQSTLAHAENALVSAKALSDIVNDLQNSCQAAQVDGEAYRVLTDELSPVDGLIADQLKGFIDCFVEQLNSIIAQVWTYDLKVEACGTESGELDYKFPLSINFVEKSSPDVSKASTSQVDIVDFAFKLAVMLYLGFDDYPIYLDELGAHSDEQHRVNLMNFVKSLVETQKCSQMFMISHYAANHGVFAQAEVCVMDDSNIVSLPKTYNQHVIMR